MGKIAIIGPFIFFTILAVYRYGKNPESSLQPSKAQNIVQSESGKIGDCRQIISGQFKHSIVDKDTILKLKLYSTKEFIAESAVVDEKYQFSFRTDSNPEKIWTIIQSTQKKEVFKEQKIKDFQGLHCNSLKTLDLEG